MQKKRAGLYGLARFFVTLLVLTVYYCHAYSSCERGTNENINRMIRRQFPKGTDFDKVTAAEVKRVETWLNDYPREILGFMSSAEAFKIAFDRAA